ARRRRHQIEDPAQALRQARGGGLGGMVPRLSVRRLRHGAGTGCRWRFQNGVNGMANDAAVTKDEIQAVFPKVAETMADALGCDVDQVKLDVSLIEGLDAESIDFLDMVFRLERAFKIKIPRGKIVENARGDLPESEFEQKGVVTDKGLAQLKAYLSEVPAE